jgi:hypothetical protein
MSGSEYILLTSQRAPFLAPAADVVMLPVVFITDTVYMKIKKPDGITVICEVVRRVGLVRCVHRILGGLKAELVLKRTSEKTISNKLLDTIIIYLSKKTATRLIHSVQCGDVLSY